MKNALCIGLVAASIIALAPTESRADERSLRICEYVSVNDKSRLRKFLKNNKLKIRNIFDSVNCNGKNLLMFAAESKALDAGELIISKLPQKVVKANLDAVKAASAHLGLAAEKRVK